MKQEQRKVTQEMLKIFTLWRKNINLGERLRDGSVLVKRKVQKRCCYYQFTALLRKLSHQDVVGGGVRHAPRIQRHLLQVKSQVGRNPVSKTGEPFFSIFLVYIFFSIFLVLISTSPDSVSSPVMYSRMLLSHHNSNYNDITQLCRPPQHWGENENWRGIK